MAINNDNDEKKFRNKVSKPLFKYARQLSNTLIGTHMGKASVVLNKPIIVGASVLELSKLLMYGFWYGYVKEKYSDKVKLGYINTDSFHSLRQLFPLQPCAVINKLKIKKKSLEV